ncbi:nitroreductase [Leifsonia rubra CMS 76R]|nr:nitroreductase [Leifsonia rubra CMS 76R]
MVKDYHRIEKGLALASPKRPFGEGPAARLKMLLPLASADSEYTTHGRSALDALNLWNNDGVVDDVIAPVRNAPESNGSDPLELFRSRHSVRDYSDRAVSEELLRSVVAAAISSPSVCNRQAWEVRFFEGAQKNAVLRHQNGNRGFGESAPVVALVTVDAKLFSGAGERNQAWIEGGIFSMSLVLALHSVGVDSCMLNLSLNNRSLNNLRGGVGLEQNELPIMMIAIGYGAQGNRRARSPRRSLDEVLRPVRSKS